MSEIAEQKAAMRREIISQRKLRHSKNTEEFTKNLLALVAQVSPNRVMVFESFGSEPETSDFIDQVGLPVLVPVTHEDHLGFKVLDTVSETSIQPGDLLFIPALAVDKSGNRLGRGKGYFDKTLAKLPDGVKVFAVIYAAEFIDEVPTDTHDCKVDGVVTEAGIHKIN